MTDARPDGNAFFESSAKRAANAAGRLTVLTASGARLNLKSEDELAGLKKRRKEWQNEAWAYYDTIGEIWFAQQFIGNCLRRIRLFAAYVDPKHPDQPPVPINLDNLKDSTEADPDAMAVTPIMRQAVTELDRLKNGSGGHGDLMFSFGLNLGVSGDCTLLGQQLVPEGGGPVQETWKVYSNDQLRLNTENDLVVMKDPEDKQGTKVDPETALAVRVWRAHPRWDSWADSPMKALLDTCDELAILSRQVRSAGRSRMNAGLLVVPSEADLQSVNPVAPQEGGGGRESSTFVQDLIEAITTPIQDEGAASAVAPLVASMKADLIEKIKLFKFDREFDKLSIEQRKELITRIANGLDIPAEVLLGMADLNHWTAWQVDEQTFKAHIEPLVIAIVQALTIGFLWPALGGIGNNADVQNIVIWYDPSRLVGHPDRAKDAVEAHDRYGISDAALRRYLGFTDEDAPTPEEIADRVRRKATIRITSPSEPAINPADVADVPGQPPGPLEANRTKVGASSGATTTRPGATTGPPSAPTSPDGRVQPGIVASGTRNRTDRLGLRLAKIDSQLRDQLLTTTDAAVFRSVEMAGASLRRKIGRDKSLVASINGVPNHLVAMTIGEAETLAIAGTTDLMAGLDDNITQRYDMLVANAQKRVRQIALEYDPELDEEQLTQQQNEDRRAGLAILLAGTTALANDLLFKGPVEAPNLGEYDSTHAVPAGLIRQSLARAGGAAAAPTPGGAVLANDGTPAGAIATGTTALDVFNSMGISVTGYTWTAGAPVNPFDPHQELDGVSFSSYDDEVLAADSGEWPFVDSYFPGDHLYCQCEAVLDFGTPLAEPDGEGD